MGGDPRIRMDARVLFSGSGRKNFFSRAGRNRPRMIDEAAPFVYNINVFAGSGAERGE